MIFLLATIHKAEGLGTGNGITTGKSRTISLINLLFCQGLSFNFVKVYEHHLGLQSHQHVDHVEACHVCDKQFINKPALVHHLKVIIGSPILDE